MRFDLKLPARMMDVLVEAQAAEATGFDGVWASESTTDPLLLLAAPALNTSRIQLGTNILVALARSPFVVASAAWELQRASGGRVALGLGTQVRGHLRDRFSVAWNAPAARLDEYVRALRALWEAFQTGIPPQFEGRHYRHTLLSPTFDPGPIDTPHIPIHVAAVNQRNAELAGRLCDGLLVHPMHTPEYIRDVLLPAAAHGAASVGRTLSDFTVLVTPFFVPDGIGGDAARERARTVLAFHGATRTYAAVLTHAGFPELPARLYAAHREHGLAEAATMVPDELIERFVVRVDPAEALTAAASRYAGLATRLLVSSRQLGATDLRPPA